MSLSRISRLALLVGLVVAIPFSTAAADQPQGRLAQAESEPSSPPQQPPPRKGLSLPGIKPPVIQPTLCHLCCPQNGGCCLDCDDFKDNATTFPERAAPPPSAPPAKFTAAPVCAIPSLAKSIPPDELSHLRSLSRQPAAASCLAATRTLMPVRAAVETGLTDEAKQIGNAYAEACFNDDVLLDHADITISEAEQLHARLVFLVDPADPDQRVQCHGFRVGNLIVTALHCIRDGNKPLPMAARTVSSPHLSQTEEILPKDGGATDWSREPNRDIAVLQIKGAPPADDDRGLDWFGQPLANDRLMTLQSNIYVRNALKLEGPVDLTPTLRIEHRPSCRLALAADGFLLHSCSTERGTSGAPLFQRSSDGLIRLVGVHAGATSGLANQPNLLACQNRAENYGVSLPSLADMRRAITAGGASR